jgi:hypothetical protein
VAALAIGILASKAAGQAGRAGGVALVNSAQRSSQFER